MVTYPSTHGVFEETITEICEIVHQHGGQVYMDGANMNAQVGLCRPGDMGADVCHLNLHKTFCIPHGGGGPGMGPIGVAAHLVDFLAGHPVVQAGRRKTRSRSSAAPWGSASILPISWMYIAMMGGEGLTRGHQDRDPERELHRASGSSRIFRCSTSGSTAISSRTNASSIARSSRASRRRSRGHREAADGLRLSRADDSCPVAGTMMIEPTESESKEELDRFCDAMIAIHGEIKSRSNRVRRSRDDNPLKNAPHPRRGWRATSGITPTAASRRRFPAAWTREHKFWPSVGRVDNVYGDRNLVCACVPTEAYVSTRGAVGVAPGAENCRPVRGADRLASLARDVPRTRRR